MAFPYPCPVAADVVLCRFPENLRNPAPGPKARPGILLKVLSPLPAAPSVYRVRVCFATSNRARLYPHEFEIARQQHPVEYESAGLSDDTKFDLLQDKLLPFDSDWFAEPKFPRFGQTPKLGVLHALSMPRLLTAYAQAEKLR